MPAKIVIDESFLIRMYVYENKTLDEIADEMNCNRHTIFRRMKPMNLTRCYEDPKWLYQQHIVLGKTLKEMTSIANCGKDTISTNMKRYGIEIKSYPRKHKYNESAFENIKDEDQAYWLGFIVADGGIEILKSDKRSTYRLRILLAQYDENHLAKFKDFISPTAELKRGKSTIKGRKNYKNVSVSIYNKKIVEDLYDLGIHPNKSANESYVHTSPELDKHFIRGNFDGDGCFSYWYRDNTLYQELSFLGSISLMQDISDVLETNLSLKGTIVQEGILYKLRFTKIDDVIKIQQWLYDKATVYLDRKHTKILEWLELRNDIPVVWKI